MNFLAAQRLLSRLSEQDRESEGTAVKIERDSKNGMTTLRLIGRLQAVHLSELKKEIKAKAKDDTEE